MTDFMVIFFEALISGLIFIAVWFFYLVKARRSAEHEFNECFGIMVMHSWVVRQGPCSAEVEKQLCHDVVSNLCRISAFGKLDVAGKSATWNDFVKLPGNSQSLFAWRELLLVKRHHLVMIYASTIVLITGLALIIGALSFLLVVSCM